VVDTPFMRNLRHRFRGRSNRSRAITRVVGVLVLLVVAGCGSSSTNELTGFGATEASWNAHHKKVTPKVGKGLGACAAPSTCYGPTITTPLGDRPQFLFVDRSDGHIIGFTYSLPTNTSEAQAKREVRSVVPSDAKPTRSGMQGTAPVTCFTWILRSAKLARALPARLGMTKGEIGVAFSSVDHNGYVRYNPKNVNEASLTIVQYTLDGC
jgi:hypothetical protein